MFMVSSVERAESSRYADTFNAHSESHESDTPRSVTPASSFYAKPKRKMGQVNTRRSSLLDLNAVNGDDTFTPPPRSSVPRSSDEGFDSSQSNSTGSNSLRSHMSIPVDANLRSMPGVVGIGEGWAGGPQGQDKKRRLWFRRKSSKKPADDPLALWSIQESDPMASPNGKGAKRGGIKDAWNRSIGKFGSTPALLSGDQVNTGSGNKSGGGIKTFFSRSRVDLIDENNTKRPVDSQAQAKKERRRTATFFGSSKSQVELSTPRARPMSTVLAPTPQSPSPPFTFTRSPYEHTVRHQSCCHTPCPDPGPRPLSPVICPTFCTCCSWRITSALAPFIIRYSPTSRLACASFIFPPRR
jgi:hypothetical protein